jgi:hypothetical protein
MMGCDSALEVEEFVVVGDCIDDVQGRRHAWTQCSWRPRHGGEEDGAESTRVMRINVDSSDVG